MDFVCSICYDAIAVSQVNNGRICNIDCGHVFHRKCLIKWFEESKTCPQCRCSTSVTEMRSVFFNASNTSDPTANSNNSDVEESSFDCDLKSIIEENFRILDRFSELVKDLLAENGKVNNLLKEKTKMLEDVLEEKEKRIILLYNKWLTAENELETYKLLNERQSKKKATSSASRKSSRKRCHSGNSQSEQQGESTKRKNPKIVKKK